MNRPARLSAIDSVRIFAPPDAASAMLWFYGELLSLPRVDTQEDRSGETIRFKSERVELIIVFSAKSTIDSVPCRACLELPSLAEIASVLDARKYAYDWIRGLCFTDRALMLVDPAGNRVLLRQLWRWY